MHAQDSETEAGLAPLGMKAYACRHVVVCVCVCTLYVPRLNSKWRRETGYYVGFILTGQTRRTRKCIEPSICTVSYYRIDGHRQALLCLLLLLRLRRTGVLLESNRGLPWLQSRRSGHAPDHFTGCQIPIALPRQACRIALGPLLM